MARSGGVLQLSEDLQLPAEAVTETFTIVAKRGSGKSHTAAVMVEEFVSAGLPVCVIDPVGVFWGLRAAADGQGPGLPVVILGGDHADLPLPVESGAAVADLVIEERVPAVLDLSAHSKRGQRRLAADFLERIYQRNRSPLHLVVDEADLLAPQRTSGEGARLLGAYEDLVRRGRARGLGCTSITQRPAVLHKDILSQSEVLIALRLNGTRDVSAIDEWVRLNADDEQAREMKASLAGLPVGTAWVWSPGWLELLRRVQIRRRRTFDSSATPRPGEQTVQPTGFAPVDLERLRARLDAGATTAADDTPCAADELARLRAELRAALDRPPRVEYIEITPPGMEQVIGEVVAQLRTLADQLQRCLDKPAAAPEAAHHGAGSPIHTEVLARAASRLGPAAAAELPPRPVPTSKPTPPDGQQRLKAGARRMLAVLARQHPLRLSRAQLATLSRLRSSGGTFSTYFSTLRRAGYLVEAEGLVELTSTGREAASMPATAPPIQPDEIREQWRGVLKAGARSMLDQLLKAHPRAMSRAGLAAAVGLELSGGTFGTYLSTLRRNGLATVEGDQVRAADVFFVQRPAS